MSSSSLRLPLVGALAALLVVGRLADLTAADIPVVTFPDGTGVRSLSAVPAPGVHPRIFLSPEDLPALREAATTSPARKAHYANLRKILADRFDGTTTAESTVVALIAKGGTPSDAQFAATTEMGYLLGLAGIDAQISNDPARGALLAQVLAAWGTYQLKAWVRKPDPVGLHNSFDTGICLAYDFIAPWMREEQRAPVRRFIAKMSDGIDIFTWGWPEHMRMWNWAGLHVYQGWGSLAIEGEDGWKPKLWEQATVVARDFARYNIHPSGALTEDLTYFTLGMQGSGLVLMALAKRGQPEVWSTATNLSKVKYHLVNQLHPWGDNFMSHQDGSGNGFYATWTILKYMYPQDPLIDYAWRERVGEDYANGGAANDAGIRAWLMVLFNTEHLPTAVTPDQWRLSTTYFCPQRSYLVARTGWDANALKLDFEAKTDYPTVGHNHADANNFTFAALGREWATEVGYHGAAGHLHNNVVIDGRSQSGWPAPGGRWLDLVDTPQATIGVSDASHAYTWQWSNSGYGTENTPPSELVKWERETRSDVVAFSRDQEGGKGRMSIFEHYGPIVRSAWNPVEKAFRTAALVRGKRPYVLIVDDIRKDSATHLYEWAMQMPSDVEVIKGGGRWVILGAKELPVAKAKPGEKNDDKPKPDKRRLLVQIVDVDLPTERDGLAIALESTQLGNDAFAQGALRKRLVIPARSSEPRFKILLYPHTEGDALPDVLWNDERSACEILFPDQRDRFSFAPAAEGRTALSLSRDDALIATVSAAPAAPELVTAARVFTDRCRVELALPGAGQEIRYTTDGSEPRADSAFYAGPFELTASTTVKAATFARRWDFGEVRQSTVITASFTKQALAAALPAPSGAAPGLAARVYAGFWNRLPDFAALTPLAATTVERIALPPGTPSKGFGVVLDGMIRIPADGVYTFALACDDPGRIWIDDQPVVDNDSQHIVRTATGEIALAAGYHRLRIANCDGALTLGTGTGDGSWAFQALWAPAGATLVEIPPEVLVQVGGAQAAAAEIPAVAAQAGLSGEPGLEHRTFDRTAQVGTAEFFSLDGTPLRADLAANAVTSDAAPGLLHVYRGFLTVPHAGVYEFRLAASTVGEVMLGDVIAVRSGVPGSNRATPVRLSEGPVPYVVKLGKGPGQVQWRGPGMSWQALTARDVVRELRPRVTIAGRAFSNAAYELLGPTTVTFDPPPTGYDLVVTRDGSAPAVGGPTYAGPMEVTNSTELRARYVAKGTVVGGEAAVRLVAKPLPEQRLVGVWSAGRAAGNTLKNGVPDAAGDLVLPDGTTLADDPTEGKFLRFEHAPKVMLTPTAILSNELTLSFRLRTSRDGALVHYGYAHFGIFLNVGKGGSVNGGGGGSWRAGGTKDGVLNDGRWHQVTATFGGTPFREIVVWVDGVRHEAGRSSSPCLTKELGFLQGFTGDLAEIRMYNRILDPAEIVSLSRGLTPVAK